MTAAAFPFNPVHQAQALLSAAYAGAQTERRSRRPFEAALRAILQAMGWVGERRRILEALPYQQPIDSPEGLRAVLHRLGFVTAQGFRPLADIDRFPAVIALPDGGALVAMGREAEGLRIYDPRTDEHRTLATGRLRAEVFTVCRPSALLTGEEKTPWINRALATLAQPIRMVLLLSLGINLCAFAAPLFTAGVYDFVVRARAMDTLIWLAAAVGVVLLAEQRLRNWRTRLLAEFGARFDAALTAAVVEKLLALPLRMVEQAPVSTQILRLREFERVRALFQGNLMHAILDLPFTVVFIAAIAWLGGPLAFVPIALAGAYGLAWVGMRTAFVRRGAKAGAASSQLSAFLMETAAKREALRSLGAAEGWGRRAAELTQDAAEKRLAAQRFETMVQTFAGALSSLAGAATLGIGALLVMDERLSIGALIAVMMLIWRVIQPIQTAFLASQRLSMVLNAATQINRLMAMPQERRKVQASLARRVHGQFALEGVAFRYGAETDAALRGVSARIEPGEIIVLAGPTGAGKSTLLKVMAGLYEPLSGAVLLDGLNLRSVDPQELRSAIAYAGQRPDMFHGTVRQNLLLIAPTADDAQLAAALAAAGVSLADPALPQGLETWVRTGGRALSPALRARLRLAGVYARNGAALLLDDPGAYLDADADAALIAQLKALRGRTTVVLASNRPSHMRAADRVIVLSRGAVAADAKPEAALAALEKLNRAAAYPNVRRNAVY